MKVYSVYPDYYDYDEFNSIVVVAENEDRALEIIKSGYYGGNYFKKHQGEIHIAEVDLDIEHIVLESFVAG